MKTAIATATALAVIGISVPQSHAGGWSTTGKVLTGVAGGLFLARALEPVPVYTAPAPVYVQQPATVTYYQPPVQQQVVVQQPVQTVQAAPAVQTVPQVQTVPAAPQVVVQQPAPVQPATVYVQQPPTVVYTAPAVVYAPPAYYYAPRPVIGFHIGFGPYYHYRHW